MLPGCLCLLSYNTGTFSRNENHLKTICNEHMHYVRV